MKKRQYHSGQLYYEVIVCYDVQCDKRRKSLYDFLLDIGLLPIQKSVFWGHACMAERNAILREFNQQLDRRTDRAFLVPAALRDTLKTAAFGHAADTLPPLSSHAIV